METINKRLSYLLTSFLPVAMLFAIIGFRQNDAVNGIKADSSYSITLNASNAPQTLTSEPTSSSFVGPKGVSFSYSLASTMASGFMNLAEYGTIENTDQITTIIGYRIVFSGNIRLSFGWSQGETLIYFTQGENLQSGVTHTIEGDYYYFSIYSMSGSSEITSITINYSCVPTPAAATYTLASDGNSYIVTGYSKYPSELVIPSTYNDLPVTEIAPYVFSSLYYLQSVYIPDSVTKIGTQAFYDCDNLESVRLPAGLLELESSIFADCGKLTTITLPETLQIIGDYAFASSAITQINIPSSVTTFGIGCFYFTQNLTTFTFDTPVSVNHIASNMFEASGLISITLPEGIESIGVNGFSNSSLETIGFPSTLTTIDDYAFYASSSFETMTGILENVTYIGSEAFEGTLWSDANLDADNLVVFDERIIVNGRDASGALTITEGIEAIASYAFLQNASLSEIIMPSSLLHIYKGAFAESNALIEVDFSLSTSLLTIGEEAFNQCESLSTLTIPTSVLDVGDWAFSGTPWQDSQLVPGEMFIINNRVVIDGTMKTGAVSLPTTITAINVSAFEGATVTSIALPDGLVRIGQEAFKNCAWLTEIVIPDTVELLGYGVFAYSSLESLIVGSSVELLPPLMCYENTGLTTVVLPSGLQEIGNQAFDTCTSLATITLPSGLISLGIECFARTQSLSSVSIPGGIEFLSQGAFMLSALASVTIGEGVQFIGENVFQDCSALTSVSLSSTLLEIWGYAFDGCSSLTSIIIPLSVSYIGDSCFGRCPSLFIYAEAMSLPESWYSTWNPDERPVTWGYGS